MANIKDYAFQNGTYEQYAVFGYGQGGGMRRDNLGLQDKIAVKEALLDPNGEERPGCILVMQDGKIVQIDNAANYSHQESVKDAFFYDKDCNELISKISVMDNKLANDFRDFFEDIKKDKFGVISQSDLKATLLFLSKPKYENELPEISKRRKDCGFAAALIESNIGDICPYVWRVWKNNCNAEQKATAEREYEEIRG